MSDPIEEFWQCFLDRRRELEQMASAQDPTYDVVLDALQKVNEGLYFEFCSVPGKNEMIITADGDVDLFPLAENIVARAPKAGDWNIMALKPKLGFPVTTGWE